MKLSDFDFELPEALIAREPAVTRSGSRLLEVGPSDLVDRHFVDLPALLSPGDLIVFNDSRVLRARLRGNKSTGGSVEALVERILTPSEALAQLRMSKPAREGSGLSFGRARAEVLARRGEFWHLRFDGPVLEILDREGEMPLPPYIDRAARLTDDERYQTAYARHPGSVAAPTAGLHFDEPLLQALEQRGVQRAFVTLHVGAGTFQPVRVDDISQHRMHSELYHVPEATVQALGEARKRGGKVVAVGTTSLRTLEAAAGAGAGEIAPGWGETDLFITPGYPFRVVDTLVTNFHLPRSTLLMLVSAFAGSERIRKAYAHAIERQYRFFSYGDAMLLKRASRADHR